jgi:hypothetical protein
MCIRDSVGSEMCIRDSTYTDLVLIFTGTSNASGQAISAIFNGSTTSQYSFTYMFGSGTGSGQSGRVAAGAYMNIGNVNATQSQTRVHFQNYSNTGVFKSTISRSSLPSQYDVAYAGLWQNTAVISSMTLNVEGSGNVFNSGCTFTLYGIKAA